MASLAPYATAVDSVSKPSRTLTLSKAHLIELNRDTRLYQWTTKAEVPFQDKRERSGIP